MGVRWDRFSLRVFFFVSQTLGQNVPRGTIGFKCTLAGRFLRWLVLFLKMPRVEHFCADFFALNSLFPHAPAGQCVAKMMTRKVREFGDAIPSAVARPERCQNYDPQSARLWLRRSLSPRPGQDLQEKTGTRDKGLGTRKKQTATKDRTGSPIEKVGSAIADQSVDRASKYGRQWPTLQIIPRPCSLLSPIA